MAACCLIDRPSCPHACRSQEVTPEQLHTDLSTVSHWLGELSACRTNVVVGLVCMDTQALQRVAVPTVLRVHGCVGGA